MALAGTRVIALEEHYWDLEISKHYGGGDGRAPGVKERLEDIDNIRIREMDEAGIDMQVLSHGNPGVQRMEPVVAVPLARQANDGLYEIISARPERFRGFATLPTPDPEAAAKELERTVKEFGFVGAMVNGPTNGVFFDDKRFWPVCEVAQSLDVPIYLHPSVLPAAVIDTYFRDYMADFPALAAAAWGFTIDTATQGIRMILSGVLDEYPNLKLILGHQGESLPFSLWRIHHGLSRGGNKTVDFREKFCKHFWITTSGHFSTPALMCSMMEMGIDRLLYSVDYPFVENLPGSQWAEQIPLSAEDREKLMNGNARRLLRID